MTIYVKTYKIIKNLSAERYALKMIGAFKREVRASCPAAPAAVPVVPPFTAFAGRREALYAAGAVSDNFCLQQFAGKVVSTLPLQAGRPAAAQICFAFRGDAEGRNFVPAGALYILWCAVRAVLLRFSIWKGAIF